MTGKISSQHHQVASNLLELLGGDGAVFAAAQSLVMGEPVLGMPSAREPQPQGDPQTSYILVSGLSGGESDFKSA
jgi:hypothetical protein